MAGRNTFELIDFMEQQFTGPTSEDYLWASEELRRLAEEDDD